MVDFFYFSNADQYIVAWSPVDKLIHVLKVTTFEIDAVLNSYVTNKAAYMIVLIQWLYLRAVFNQVID